MDKISINDFTELIWYRQPVRVKSSKGQVKETFTDYRKSLVKIEISGNDEIKENERLFNPENLTISAHYDSTINQTFQLIWNTEYYNITSITPVQNRLFMVVRAERKLNNTE